MKHVAQNGKPVYTKSMTYPTGTPVHTFLLAGEPSLPENLVATVVVVLRDLDGEVRTVTVADHYLAQHYCDLAQQDGQTVLCVVEGEQDLGYGTTSVWCAR